MYHAINLIDDVKDTVNKQKKLYFLGVTIRQVLFDFQNCF